MITIEQLRTICPFAPKNVDVFIPYLNKFLPEYGIETPDQVAMFLAQAAHESGQFRYTQEIASGKAYEGRRDLGNVHPGDGVKFKGRGIFQITGRSNYEKCGKALDLDLMSTPDLLSTPQYAVQSACWYWQSRDLNRFANDLRKCTRAINGGYNGLDDRRLFWERAKKVI